MNGFAAPRITISIIDQLLVIKGPCCVPTIQVLLRLAGVACHVLICSSEKQPYRSTHAGLLFFEAFIFQADGTGDLVINCL